MKKSQGIKIFPTRHQSRSWRPGGGVGGWPARDDSFQEWGQDRRAVAGDADGETGETGWYDRSFSLAGRA